MDSHWALVERSRLRKTWVSAQSALAECHIELQEYALGLQVFQHLNSEEPFLEEAWQGAVQTLARMGNRAAALAYYDQFAKVLWEELGIEPGAESQALQRRIMIMSP